MTILESPGRGLAVAVEPVAGIAAQIGLLALLGAGAWVSFPGWLTGVTVAVVLSVLLTAAMRRAGGRALGPADRVTLVRAELVGAVAALVVSGFTGVDVPPVLIVGVATVALLLDKADGYVARRTGTASALGARFDMEVDAFLILLLSLHIAETVGWWTLAIGAMRYVYWGAMFLIPWLAAPVPPRFSRKAVAGIQGIVLVAVSAQVLPTPVAATATVGALALLTWSFGWDVHWLWRHRAEGPLPS